MDSEGMEIRGGDGVGEVGKKWGSEGYIDKASEARWNVLPWLCKGTRFRSPSYVRPNKGRAAYTVACTQNTCSGDVSPATRDSGYPGFAGVKDFASAPGRGGGSLRGVLQHWVHIRESRRDGGPLPPSASVVNQYADRICHSLSLTNQF
jgi:hypothetical protein